MKLNELIKKIQKKKILVIGDVMIDSYYFGSSDRISPEAPTPILLEKYSKKILGGAANVAVNLASANQEVSILSVIGDDNNGEEMLRILKEKNIDNSLVIKDSDRCTIVKNRFIGQNNIQMFRFDQEINTPISDKIFEKIYKTLEKEIEKFDILIISDYNKGLLSVENTPKIIELANKNKVKVLVDIKEPKYDKYKGAYIIKPNKKELEEITKIKIDGDSDLLKASKELKKHTNCTYVLVTLGKDGMALLKDDKLYKIECVSREVYDVTGAGDTVISYLSVCLANGYDLIDSANIASYAAGVKVSKMGTYAVKPRDIMDYIMDSNNVLDEEKIIDVDKLSKILEGRGNKKIVFTNGCFDIFHVGHLRYLKESAKYGDILVIGVNSDKSVKKLKGDSRPIIPEDERMELLASLSFVSYVVKFDEDTPHNIIEKIKPDYITKGGDYKKEDVVGKDIADIIIIPLVENKSTTNIINKVLNKYE